MNIVSTLNEKLLKQPFLYNENESQLLDKFKRVAYGYSVVENALAVLSDLKANKSYIYNGGLADELDIAKKGTEKEIDTIWEEDIFNRIHPDDLLRKHTFELQFFHQMKDLSVDERANYYVSSIMRMKDKHGDYRSIQHRMFYVCSSPEGALWLSFCLYSKPCLKIEQYISEDVMINSLTGKILIPDENKQYTILTSREKEILQLIENGNSSKEIANKLSISVYTINRHRQNILEKLRVRSSFQACRVAKFMGLL